ncbi:MULTISPECIES: hypothetical protein [Gordonia]|uniref:Uncharacterized protein n=1 Tax=Gordonia sputi NBRC 100414 TaxID=1089453 RepID=H5TYE6_9ACTN|nr:MULTISPECIES: hypothetical protein [Gordonia]NKY92743.1 hypothetical protein [Gordonia sputi]OBA38483.1 hypothetical protein A5766_04700 [Gordonia sp. 852002-51296_SCH5728562-b]GAB38504.1 hypothetical protein GOSPT_045_01420 [Gordonia sputi NBRC 100414]
MSAAEPDGGTHARPRPASGLPARNYSWEPFVANNTKSLKHGAYSERVITPMAAQIGNDLVEAHPHLREFKEATLEYARVDAQVECLQMWVDEHGELDDAGQPTGATVLLLRTRKHLLNLADRLGITPLARARLGKDTTSAQLDIAKILAGDASKPTSIDGEVESEDGAA